MTIKEARKIIAVFMVTYPSYKPIDTEFAAQTWADALEGYSYEDANNGIKAYIRTNASGFAPSPGQVIEKIQMINDPEEMNEMEAWALVSRAIRNSGYNSQKEFDKLPETVQKAIGSPNQLYAWAVDSDYNESVISSHFIKCYRTVTDRKKILSKMPQSIRNLVEKVNMHQIEAK